jgi:hypothetical protein
MSVPDAIRDDVRRHFARIRELNDALRMSGDQWPR